MILKGYVEVECIIALLQFARVDQRVPREIFRGKQIKRLMKSMVWFVNGFCSL